MANSFLLFTQALISDHLQLDEMTATQCVDVYCRINVYSRIRS